VVGDVLGMPKVLLLNGFSFLFYSNEGSEPPHIHIKKGDAEAKFWLEPTIEMEFSEDFSASELRFIRETIEENREEFLRKWHEHLSR
jgi:hypothetical protein